MKAIVCHSGGMDSSICLALAIQRFGAENVLSVGFDYKQRHQLEINQAKFICDKWQVKRRVIGLNCLNEIGNNSLQNHKLNVQQTQGQAANSLVVGRNGLMLRLCAMLAADYAADIIYSGITEVEAKHSGYRDSDRKYIDLLQKILCIDLANPNLQILTPVAKLSKAQGMQLAAELGVLDFLLKNTVTCYNGIMSAGCGKCPACMLRNAGITEYNSKNGTTHTSKIE